MDSGVHRVREGESLTEIALKYRCTVLELARVNGIPPSTRVWVGQVVRLPPSVSSHLERSEEPEEPRFDIEHFTNSMKVSKALELSWRSWPAQLAGTAKESFSDPAFVTTLLVVMGIYAGLWLTPDPTMLTKVLAGTLTVVLLTQFAWEDIYGLAEAWFALREQCSRARTLEQLQEAGDTFAKKVGHVGFDLLLFLVMWRVGKQVEPRLTELGVKRALTRAEARVATAEAQPGSRVGRPAQGPALKVLQEARDQANSADPSRILDVLGSMLPEIARRGLAVVRGRYGDVNTLKDLTMRLNPGGQDLVVYLTHQGVTAPAVDAAQAELWKARELLARAQLLRMQALRDPLLRRAMRDELCRYLGNIMRSLESPPDWKQISSAIQTRDIPGLAASIGEAVQRSLLSRKYQEAEGYRIFANVEHLRQVEGFTRIEHWQDVERAAGRSGDPKGLYEWQGKLWKSVTEVDAVVARRGPGGKWRLVELEQMKTGKNDQPIRAHEQNIQALSAMKMIASGNEKIRLATRVGEHALGADLTEDFDYSSLTEVKLATRGVEGKKFDREIPLGRELLEKIARTIVEQGLPSSVLPVPPSGREEPGGQKVNE